jgi:hypothetical protein
MRGGAQSHLMRCSDDHYYVVNFQNNSEHTRLLGNEMLGTRLAARLGLPTTLLALVEVSPELIALIPELCVDLPRSSVPCASGLQFGSRYPGDPLRVDYGYRYNGTRGFVQLISASRSPSAVKEYAYTAEQNAPRAPFKSEFAAVTAIPFESGNVRHQFIPDTLREARIEPIPVEAFARYGSTNLSPRSNEKSPAAICRASSFLTYHLRLRTEHFP